MLNLSFDIQNPLSTFAGRGRANADFNFLTLKAANYVKEQTTPQKINKR